MTATAAAESRRSFGKDSRHRVPRRDRTARAPGPCFHSRRLSILLFLAAAGVALSACANGTEGAIKESSGSVGTSQPQSAPPSASASSAPPALTSSPVAPPALPSEPPPLRCDVFLSPVVLTGSETDGGMLLNAAGMANNAAATCEVPEVAGLLRAAAGLYSNAQGMLSVGETSAAEGLTANANSLVIQAAAEAQAGS